MGHVRDMFFADDLLTVRHSEKVHATTDVASDIVNRPAIVVSVGKSLEDKLKQDNPKVNLDDYRGAIQFAFQVNSDMPVNSSNIAFASNPYMVTYPINGEAVFITQISDSMFIYSNVINFNNSVNNNVTSLYNDMSKINDSDLMTSTRDNGGSVDMSNVEDDVDDFKYRAVKSANMNPGDILFEGRYSQYLKFGSENDGISPIVVLGTNKPSETSTDLQNNDSVIMLTSKQKVNTPVFSRYPSVGDIVNKDLLGNQIFILSDRIFIGSKKNEVLITSNANIHLSSMGYTTIDSAFCNIASNVVEIKSNTVEIGSGDNMESVAKANSLISILTKLLTYLSTDVILIDNGGKSVGSKNASKYSQLIEELNTVMSKNVRVS